MKNFQKVHDNIDIVSLYNSVMRQPELWNTTQARKEFVENSPHKEVEDIILRGQKEPEHYTRSNVLKAQWDLQCFNYPAFYKLPQARPFIFGLMSRLEGEQLGRVLITKLEPGKQIYKHKDQGGYAEHYNRYHLVLSSGPGSIFYVEDEQINMKTGDAWWVDKSAEHWVINNSDTDRVHLIIDIRFDKQ